MKRNVIIYHHNDTDGIVSGSIIYEYERGLGSEITTNKIDYTQELIIPENIDKDTIFYFVDYSFSNSVNIDVLIKLIVNGYNVIWIDHHISSLKALGEFSDDILKKENFVHYINTKYCASVLCFRWCYSKIYRIEDLNVIKPESVLLRYVDSWDCWKHDMPNSKEFNTGFISMDVKPEEFYDKATHDIFINSRAIGKSFIDECLFIGKIMCDYLDRIHKATCKKNGFEFIINYFDKEYKCFGVNNYGNSTVFGDMINEYDIVCLFNYVKDKFKYSIYTAKDDIHCDQIANNIGKLDNLGGGGHKGAAGFQTYEDILSEDCSVNIYKNIFGKTKIKIKESDY